jgi:hypothetical protein
VLGVGLSQHHGAIQLEVTVEVNFLVQETVPWDLGLSSLVNSLVKSFHLTPGTAIILVKERNLVVATSNELVLIDENAVEVRITCVEKFLTLWLLVAWVRNINKI